MQIGNEFGSADWWPTERKGEAKEDMDGGGENRYKEVQFI